MSNKPNIEELIEKLEKNADRLRSGDISMDESIKVFEESKELYEKASSILKETKQKIEIYDPIKGDTEEFNDI